MLKAEEYYLFLHECDWNGYGYYVCINHTSNEGQPFKSWKRIHGPFSKPIAEDTAKELLKDLGKPMNVVIEAKKFNER